MFHTDDGTSKGMRHGSAHIVSKKGNDYIALTSAANVRSPTGKLVDGYVFMQRTGKLDFKAKIRFKAHHISSGKEVAAIRLVKAAKIPGMPKLPPLTKESA